MGITRAEIDRLLFGKLPEVLSAEQKRNKVHNMLRQLARQDVIVNRGSRNRPQWCLGRGMAREIK